MTTYEPHPDNPAPKDGDRVKVGEVEGKWVEGKWEERKAFNLSHYSGYITTDAGCIVHAIKGVPITVLRPVEITRSYYMYCGETAKRLVPEREPVDLEEAIQVWKDNIPGPTDEALRAILAWAGVPVRGKS